LLENLTITVGENLMMKGGDPYLLMLGIFEPIRIIRVIKSIYPLHITPSKQPKKVSSWVRNSDLLIIKTRPEMSLSKQLIDLKRPKIIKRIFRLHKKARLNYFLFDGKST
jgi:hypothetical protein